MMTSLNRWKYGKKSVSRNGDKSTIIQKEEQQWIDQK